MGGTYNRSYTYDSQGQLLTETVNDTTYTYTYDTAGNILTASDGTTTHTYTYGDTDWGDLLTAYDGESITYDGIGNPTSYYNGTRWSFGWEHGRELVSASNGTTTWNYTYNSDDLRTSRTNGSTTYKYLYNGSSLVQMTVGGNTLYFTDDTVTFNNTVYYYVKNLQGDVIGILNGSGSAVVQYTYDAWGNVLSITGSMADTLGQMNPLRYRGYVYDTETGLYYLQSRYYDPKVGRFINADAFASTGQGMLGNNMFSYCHNSPVALNDSSGHAVEMVFDIASIAFSLIELIAAPSWANVGFLAWDVVSTFIPFIPGSYVADIGKIGIKVASKVDDFADGAQFLTGSYKKLKKLFKGIANTEIHHIIEKRFVRLFDCNPRDFLSIPLTEDLHRIITNRWRNLPKVDEIFKNFGYGADYSLIDYAAMERAIYQVYGDMPQILDEALACLEQNWRR